MTANSCPLCKSSDSHIYADINNRIFYKCNHCDLVYLEPSLLCSTDSEKSRYLEHNNSELSDGYKRFLYNIINPIKENQSSADVGLDFGCGPYPMMSKLLEEEGYLVDDYDPYFSDFKLDFKSEKYDYVVLCEVIEHFSNPQLELERIKTILNDGGILYIQTSILTKSIDFKSWWYKDDITHVSFFSDNSFDYICEKFNMQRLESKHKNIVILKSKGSLS